MKCEQFERRLNQVFDQRDPLSKQRDLVQHADDCEACHAQLAAAMMVEDACRVESQNQLAEKLSDDFSNRVVQQYLAMPVELAHRPQAKPLVSPMVLATLAGMLLLAILPLIAWIAKPANRNDLAQVAPVSTDESESERQSQRPILPFSGNTEKTGSFLGPPPFSTGGNLALALTIMPISEKIGLSQLERDAIPGIDRIADSIQRVVHIIRWTLPPFPFQSF